MKLIRLSLTNSYLKFEVKFQYIPKIIKIKLFKKKTSIYEVKIIDMTPPP
jgi:hypothetical protein